MSDRGARATSSVVALEPKANVRPEAGDPLEKAGHLILEMIGKAASAAEVNYQQVVETSRKLSGQLRGAEDRIRELEVEVRRHQDERIGPRSGCIKSRWRLSRNSLIGMIAVPRSHLLHKQFPARRARLFHKSPQSSCKNTDKADLGWGLRNGALPCRR